MSDDSEFYVAEGRNVPIELFPFGTKWGTARDSVFTIRCCLCKNSERNSIQDLAARGWKQDDKVRPHCPACMVNLRKILNKVENKTTTKEQGVFFIRKLTGSVRETFSTHADIENKGSIVNVSCYDCGRISGYLTMENSMAFGWRVDHTGKPHCIDCLVVAPIQHKDLKLAETVRLRTYEFRLRTYDKIDASDKYGVGDKVPHLQTDNPCGEVIIGKIDKWDMLDGSDPSLLRHHRDKTEKTINGNPRSYIYLKQGIGVSLDEDKIVSVLAEDQSEPP